MSARFARYATVFATPVVWLSISVSAAAQAEIYLGRSSTPADLLAEPLAEPRQPVLFVHGHNLASDDDTGSNGFNYRKNFHDDPAAQLTSFQDTLEAPANAWLGIEPYYIRFQDQHRSIVEDADDIADAVERIIQRHDPAYVPGMDNPTTQVRVAIIAFSKGTLSSRLYLKNLSEVTGSRSGFNPISELVAISPPNHGLDVLSPTNDATKQLNNECSGCLFGGCVSYIDPDVPGFDPDLPGFIERLNGHPIEDTKASGFDPAATYASEAPLSRLNGAPLSAGTLYACLYADGHRDFVGGSEPSTDCQGRVLAANLSAHAVNREVATIPGASSTDVHRNSPHTAEVICRALATVVHHRAPPEGGTCALEVPRIPLRTSVELVLDFSGSMLTPTSPGGPTRLAVLQQAVEIFCELYAAFAGPGDRLGAVFFGTQATEFTFGDARLMPVTGVNVQALVDELVGRTTVPSEMTAMGAGLSVALAALTAPEASGAAARHIVLFTDGMQNVPPLVSTPPPPLSISTTPPTPLDASLGVAIHTIGVGAASPFVALLTGIANETGGLQEFTVDADADLQEFFDLSLIEALKGNSPELVDYRHGTFAGATLEEDFSLGAGATKLVLQLNWRGKAALAFTVERDGVDVTALGHFVEGRAYRLFIADLATNGATSAGSWTMRITGDANARYDVAAIVDEPRLDMDAVLLRRSVRAGEPIDLRVELRLEGLPLEASATVRARVMKPEESAGNLLALNERSEPPGFTLEGADPAQRKLSLLLADEHNWQRLRATVRADVELVRTQPGIYTGSFRNSDVPGLYRIEVEAESDSQATGPFRRRRTLVAVVRLGALDLAASDLHVTELARGGGDRNVELSLRPRDAFGNFLGPGWGSLIGVSVDGKSADLAAHDELDGTYRVSIAVPAEADPGMTIAIDGETLYAGPLSGIGGVEPRSRRWIVIVLLTLLVFALVLIARRVFRGSPA